MENDSEGEIKVETPEEAQEKSEGVTKKIFSLLFFGVLLASFLWLQKNGGLSFLDKKPEPLESQVETEEDSVDAPNLLESYLPEVTDALEHWREQANLGEEIKVSRLRHSDDLQKLLVEYELTSEGNVLKRDMVLDRDEFARFVYSDPQSGFQVTVYSPAEQRTIRSSEGSD